MSIKFLKGKLSDETYAALEKELEGKDDVRIVNGADGSWVPKDTHTAALARAKTAEETVAERDKQLETLKGNSKDKELQAKIDELTTENKTIKEAAEKELQKTIQTAAIARKLEGAKARDAKAVMPYVDTDKLVFKDDAVYGLDEQLTAIAKEHPFLFESTDNPGGPTNPGGDDDNKTPEYDKMTDEEYFAAKATEAAKTKDD